MRRVLDRVAVACLALLVLDFLVFAVGFVTCPGEGVGCAAWHESMNLITYLALPVLVVLSVLTGIAALVSRAFGRSR
jgi:hypothetical protein